MPESSIDVAKLSLTLRSNAKPHIQVWDGRRWISDFIQQDFWPGPGYRKSKPSFAIYRH